jgi:hypothetical protein
MSGFLWHFWYGRLTTPTQRREDFNEPAVRLHHRGNGREFPVLACELRATQLGHETFSGILLESVT